MLCRFFSVTEKSFGVQYNTFSDVHSRKNDEQWITVEEPNYNSGFHSDSGFRDVTSGTVIHSSALTTLQALYISFLITNSIFLYYPVFTLH